MYVDQESIFYYLTVMNEQYAMPPMPEGAREGILKGLYSFRATSMPAAKWRAQLFGSGAILPEVVKAQDVLEKQYNVGADVWSVTSYKQLYRDGHACERWNMLHPGEAPRVPYVTQCLKDAPGVFVAASDYVKALPDSIDRWLPRPLEVARHRRLRPQRKPREPSRLLRSRSPLHRRRDASCAGAGRQAGAVSGAGGDAGARRELGEAESGGLVDGRLHTS